MLLVSVHCDFFSVVSLNLFVVVGFIFSVFRRNLFLTFSLIGCLIIFFCRFVACSLHSFKQSRLLHPHWLLRNQVYIINPSFPRSYLYPTLMWWRLPHCCRRFLHLLGSGKSYSPIFVNFCLELRLRGWWHQIKVQSSFTMLLARAAVASCCSAG